MDQRCPHCGFRLPASVDAFCPECRERLDESPLGNAGPRVAARDHVTGGFLGPLMLFGGVGAIVAGLVAGLGGNWAEVLYTGGVGVGLVLGAATLARSQGRG